MLRIVKFEAHYCPYLMQTYIPTAVNKTNMLRAIPERSLNENDSDAKRVLREREYPNKLNTINTAPLRDT